MLDNNYSHIRENLFSRRIHFLLRLEQPRVHSSVWDIEPMLHPNLTKIRLLSSAAEKESTS